jgi:hypothetical protein
LEDGFVTSEGIECIGSFIRISFLYRSGRDSVRLSRL